LKLRNADLPNEVLKQKAVKVCENTISGGLGTSTEL
tara:strand:- start:470 stop:577 length:108 start_codon:yes stop_codon:yes gene_type:complete